MVLFEHTNNTTKQGNVGLSRAIYEFTRLGYTVLIPLTDSNEYDLVVEKDGVFSRVQCKTTSMIYKRSHNLFSINLLKSDKKHNIRKKATNYDILFVLTADDECFLIPSSECSYNRIRVPRLGFNNSKCSKYRMSPGSVSKIHPRDSLNTEIPRNIQTTVIPFTKKRGRTRRIQF